MPGYFALREREIVRRIDSRRGRAVEERDADRNAVQQGPQLLQTFPALLGNGGQFDPSLERFASVSVDSHVLVVDSGTGPVTIEGNGRPREVGGPAIGAHHHLHAAGVGNERGVEGAGGCADGVPLLQSGHRPAQRLGGNEGLVALYIQDEVKRLKLFIGNDFSNSLRATLVLRRGHDCFEPCPLHDGRDFPRVGCHDQAVAEIELGDTSDYPEDERITCQRQEGLLWQSAGAQPSGDHTEEGHRARYKSRAVESRPWPVPPSRSSPIRVYRTRCPPTPDGIVRRRREIAGASWP